jgi:glycosyltransferase involved in cell wall biosynthesis
MRIIWLAGWYPTKPGPLSGNFIRRHFLAAHQQAHPHHQIDLYTFVPYPAGNPKPEPVPESLPQEHVIAVPQFQGLGKGLNLLIYYFFVLRTCAKWMQYPIDILHVHAADKIGFFAAWIKPVLKFNLYLTEHWAIFEQDVADAFEKRSWWFRWNYANLWKQTDRIARINHHLFHAMCRTFQTTPKSMDFFNILDSDLEEALSQPSQKEKKIQGLHFLHISNGEPRKNVAFIVEAFARFRSAFPEAQLTLIGVNREASSYEHQGVQVLGSLPPKALSAYFKDADALVLVSDAENAPCVILEAHCFGVPTIVTLVGGISEMCSEHNAIQIPAFKTLEEKAEKIYRALLEFHAKKSNFDSTRIQHDARVRYQGIFVAKRLIESYENQICVA